VRRPDGRAAESQAYPVLAAVTAWADPAHGGSRGNWFARALLELGLADAPFIWRQPGIPDDELAPLDDADWQADVAAWHAECERSRAAAAGKDLDYQGLRNGEPLPLRWIYLHMNARTRLPRERPTRVLGAPRITRAPRA
jgi:hypothetical protein